MKPPKITPTNQLTRDNDIILATEQHHGHTIAVVQDTWTNPPLERTPLKTAIWTSDDRLPDFTLDLIDTLHPCRMRQQVINVTPSQRRNVLTRAARSLTCLKYFYVQQVNRDNNGSLSISKKSLSSSAGLIYVPKEAYMHRRDFMRHLHLLIKRHNLYNAGYMTAYRINTAPVIDAYGFYGIQNALYNAYTVLDRLLLKDAVNA